MIQEAARPRRGGGNRAAWWWQSRLMATISHYRGRAWRWGRVMLETRAGSVTPAPAPRRALVVRLDGIGDFALWTGAARVLRAWLGPETHVTLAANALWADLARDASIADEVWPIERGPLEHDGRYRAALGARVRGAGFSMAINPRFTREMMLGDSLVRWSGAAERIGVTGDDVLLPPRERRWADAWYTRLLASSPQPMHESERHAEVLRALGVALHDVPRPSLRLPRGATESVPRGATDGAPPGGGAFVIFPGASAAGHRWPASHFAAVARVIHQRTGWLPLVLGAEADGALGHAVVDVVPSAINLAGRTTVAELVAVVGNARLVLTNDTAAVHIAAATGVRAICIAGGWHWERFVPYPASLGDLADRVHTVSMVDEMPCFRCRGYCSLPHRAGEPRPCVERVSVERVLATVDHVLSLPDMQSDG